jgi:hypothetical protein
MTSKVRRRVKPGSTTLILQGGGVTFIAAAFGRNVNSARKRRLVFLLAGFFIVSVVRAEECRSSPDEWERLHRHEEATEG